MKGSLPLPLFQCWKQILKHPRIVLQHFLGAGVTTDEKDVFIQIQNYIVSSKALVLVNCLNTFVHDCTSHRITLGVDAILSDVNPQTEEERCLPAFSVNASPISEGKLLGLSSW